MRTQAMHRNMLIKAKKLSGLKYLLRQELSVRGHKKGECNLIQLLKLQSDDCAEMKQWLISNIYLSHDVVN